MRRKEKSMEFCGEFRGDCAASKAVLHSRSRRSATLRRENSGGGPQGGRYGSIEEEAVDDGGFPLESGDEELDVAFDVEGDVFAFLEVANEGGGADLAGVEVEDLDGLDALLVVGVEGVEGDAV